MYGILLFIILGCLAPAIYIFVAQKVFTLQLNYIWVVVYFSAQIFAIFFVNPLICYVIAVHVIKVRRNGQRAELLLLCKWLRESLIIYEDY